MASVEGVLKKLKAKAKPGELEGMSRYRMAVENRLMRCGPGDEEDRQRNRQGPRPRFKPVENGNRRGQDGGLDDR